MPEVKSSCKDKITRSLRSATRLTSWLIEWGDAPAGKAYAGWVSEMTNTRPPEHLGLLAAGYVMAFALPIGGLVVGCLMVDKRPGHGVAMLMLSVWSFMLLAWLVVSATT
jgi:hypothetical protein